MLKMMHQIISFLTVLCSYYSMAAALPSLQKDVLSSHFASSMGSSLFGINKSFRPAAVVGAVYPTIATQVVIEKSFQGSSCNGPLSSVIVYPIGICLNQYNTTTGTQNQVTDQSFVLTYNTTTGYPTFTTFTLPNCAGTISSLTQPVNQLTTCSSDPQTSYLFTLSNLVPTMAQPNPWQYQNVVIRTVTSSCSSSAVTPVVYFSQLLSCKSSVDQTTYSTSSYSMQCANNQQLSMNYYLNTLVCNSNAATTSIYTSTYTSSCIYSNANSNPKEYNQNGDFEFYSCSPPANTGSNPTAGSQFTTIQSNIKPFASPANFQYVYLAQYSSNNCAAGTLNSITKIIMTNACYYLFDSSGSQVIGSFLYTPVGTASGVYTKTVFTDGACSQTCAVSGMPESLVCTPSGVTSEEMGNVYNPTNVYVAGTNCSINMDVNTKYLYQSSIWITSNQIVPNLGYLSQTFSNANCAGTPISSETQSLGTVNRTVPHEVPTQDIYTCSGNTYTYTSTVYPAYAMNYDIQSTYASVSNVIGQCDASYDSNTKTFTYKYSTCANAASPSSDNTFTRVLSYSGVVGTIVGTILGSMLCCCMFFFIGRYSRPTDSLANKRDTIPDVHKI